MLFLFLFVLFILSLHFCLVHSMSIWNILHRVTWRRPQQYLSLLSICSVPSYKKNYKRKKYGWSAESESRASAFQSAVGILHVVRSSDFESELMSTSGGGGGGSFSFFQTGYFSNGAFPLHGTVRFGAARYGTVRLSSGRFAFPPQFSTAIEWAGLFTRRYNCAASTAVTSP